MLGKGTVSSSLSIFIIQSQAPFSPGIPSRRLKRSFWRRWSWWQSSQWELGSR